MSQHHMRGQHVRVTASATHRDARKGSKKNERTLCPIVHVLRVGVGLSLATLLIVVVVVIVELVVLHRGMGAKDKVIRGKGPSIISARVVPKNL